MDVKIEDAALFGEFWHDDCRHSIYEVGKHIYCIVTRGSATQCWTAIPANGHSCASIAVKEAVEKLLKAKIDWEF